MDDESQDIELKDLRARLRPVVEQVALDAGLTSSPTQIDVLVARLAAELRRDLGVI